MGKNDRSGRAAPSERGFRAASGEWVASTLEFSTAGCWAVTVSYRDATISYQILIRDSAQPSSTLGTIIGTLRETGGTVPTAQAVSGTITMVGKYQMWAGATASDGTFSATVRADSYRVSATTADGGGMTCSAGDVVVRAGQTTEVDVDCNVP